MMVLCGGICVIASASFQVAICPPGLPRIEMRGKCSQRKR